VQLASAAHPVGAVQVDNGDWAIGSMGNGWAHNFAGSIDEVAIYSSALSASQVAAHYAAGTAQPKLTITKVGSNVSISWPYGTLQAADFITGPWTNVPSATSPYVVPATGTKFYRF
jgi:hypothetical protein